MAAWPELLFPGSPQQAEEKQLAIAERAVGELQRRSQEVAPLPQRRSPPKQPLHVDSICDWDSGEVGAPPALLAPPQPLSPPPQPLSPTSPHCFCL